MRAEKWASALAWMSMAAVGGALQASAEPAPAAAASRPMSGHWMYARGTDAVRFVLYEADVPCPPPPAAPGETIAFSPRQERYGLAAHHASLDALDRCSRQSPGADPVLCQSASLSYRYSNFDYTGRFAFTMADGSRRSGEFVARFCSADLPFGLSTPFAMANPPRHAVVPFVPPRPASPAPRAVGIPKKLSGALPAWKVSDPVHDVGEFHASATIQFTIDRDGRTHSVSVLKATHAFWGERAADAVLGFTYEAPRTADGQAVPLMVQQEFKLRID